MVSIFSVPLRLSKVNIFTKLHLNLFTNYIWSYGLDKSNLDTQMQAQKLNKQNNDYIEFY